MNRQLHCHMPYGIIIQTKNLIEYIFIANFRDSKEIMVTSDSEAAYKYSSSNFVPIRTAFNPQCPSGELRCVDGKCITIGQLCDKVSY